MLFWRAIIQSAIEQLTTQVADVQVLVQQLQFERPAKPQINGWCYKYALSG